jgi:hypothetical protein
MKRRFAFFVSLMLLLILAISACAPAAATQSPLEMSAGSAPQPAADSSKTFENSYASSGIADSPSQGETRLVIRNANLSIVVIDPGKAMDSIAAMAEEMGGFIVTSNLYKTTTNEGVEIPQAEITLRVPAEKLSDATSKIKALVENPAVDILSENVSGQDVTKEYTDTKSRLTNLEAAEKQLQNIMDAATKTEDVLAVYNQLVQVREQIEVLKGQVKYYEESAALSAISVSLRAQASVQPVVIAGWRPVGVARSAVQALINTLQFLGSAAIWIVIYILPVGVILVLFFLLLRFLWRKIFKTKPRKTPAAQPPAVQPPSNPTTLN